MSARSRPHIPTARRSNPFSHRWKVLVGVAAVALAFLAATPVASATYTLRISPPFLGVEPILATTIDTVGCHSRAEFPLAPRVNATNGEIHERLGASSRYCAGSPAGPNYADVAAFPGFNGTNFTVPASGLYTATYEWVFSYNASLNASGPVDTGYLTSSATAIVSLFALGYLYDRTNATVLDGNGGSAVVLFHEIHEGSWTGGAVRLSVRLVNSFALVTGHLYYFETVLTVNAEGLTNVDGNASATLNLGTSGDHARLVGLALVGP